MNKDIYGTIFLKKCGSSVTQFMLEERYPFFSEQNKLFYLKFNLRKYICLDDLINGKLNQMIIISNEGLILIFYQLYFLLKQLRVNQLEYFRIEKKHIWIKLDANQIEGLILSHPSLDFEKQNQNQRLNYQIFTQIYNLLELHELKPNLKKLLELCLENNMKKVENIEPNYDQCIAFSKEIFKKLELYIIKFQERLNEIQCNINEFKYILENIPYYFYQAILQNKCLNELIDRALNNLSDIKTLCKKQNSYKYLDKFIIQEEIIIKLNDQDYLIDGCFKKEYQLYLEQQRSSNKSLSFTHSLLGQISNTINIDEQQILEIINELDNDFEECIQEQKLNILERIQQNIILQVRKRLQDLG